MVACFVGGNPMSAVRRGEIQGSILGMDIHVYDDNGKYNDAVKNYVYALVYLV